MKRILQWYDYITINIYWLGINIASGIITPVLLPYLVLLFVPVEKKNTYLATIRVIGLSVAMMVQPMAGVLSDRNTSKRGRRRPYILGGTLADLVFLLIIGSSPLWIGSSFDGYFQPSFGVSTAYAILLVGIVLLQVSSNFAHGALQGLIPDIVPEDQRGRASGVKAVMELLPSFLVIFIGPLVDGGKIWLTVGIIMAALLVTMLITWFYVKEEKLNVKPDVPVAETLLRLVVLTAIFVGVTQAALWLVRTSGKFFASQGMNLNAQIILVGLSGLGAMAGAIIFGVYFGAWTGIGKQARKHTSFIWWVVNRLLFLAAVGSIQSFAQYFLADVHKIPKAATMTTMLLAVVAVFLIPSALGGGYLSDKIGKKRLVSISGIIAAAGTVLLLFSGNIPLVMVSGCIIGIGTGIFMATNWALGTDLAPAAEAGKYLGISNLAGAGAGIIGAGIGGPLADFFNGLQSGLGYLVIFGIYAGLFLFSSLVLTQVKGVERVPTK